MQPDKTAKATVDPSKSFVHDSFGIDHRENLEESFYAQFEDYILDLLTAKMTAPEMSDRGRLNPRRLWRNGIDGNIFDKPCDVPSSDTALVILLDASSSMNDKNQSFDSSWRTSNLDLSAAICSAFARANKELCGNAIRLEVFLKTSTSMNLGSVLGENPCFVTRAYTSQKDMDPKTLLKIETSTPLKQNRERGSSTPEYAVLPAVYQWAHDNINEPNKVLLNLTDGEPMYCAKKVDSNYSSHLSKSDLRNLRYKYLKDWQEICILLGDCSWTDPFVYSDNPIIANNQDFAPEFFSVLSNLMEENL